MPATSRRPFLQLSFLPLVLLVLVLAAGRLPAARSSPGQDAETCGACHEDLVKSFSLQPHAQVGAASCTSCHGSATKHVEEEGKGGVFAFRAENPAQEKSGRCLSCHYQDAPEFGTSPHAKAALDCTTCHSVHGSSPAPSLLRAGVNMNCASCHNDVFAEFELNERHRLREGIMTCATCHDPHGPSTRMRLAGFKQQECLKCHTDKGGPFLYEHAASRVEGCQACHVVHGSPNRHLLTYQNTADLCFSCHADAPAWHGQFTSLGTNCVTCHATIHGSNLSHRFLK